jgi:hypothetical protein
MRTRWLVLAVAVALVATADAKWVGARFSWQEVA